MISPLNKVNNAFFNNDKNNKKSCSYSLDNPRSYFYSIHNIAVEKIFNKYDSRIINFKKF